MESLNPDRKNTVSFKVSSDKEERISYVEVARAVNENFQAKNVFCLQPKPNGNYNLTFTNVGTVLIAKENGIRFRNEVLKVESVNQLSTIIWIQDAPVELHHNLISRKLQEYGEVKDISYVKIKEELGGYYNGDRRANIILKKSVPSYLKVGRFTLRIRYRGMVQTCRRCGESGHLARECDKDLICKVCSKRGHIGINCDLNQPIDTTEEEFQDQLGVETQENDTGREDPLLGKLNWVENRKEEKDPEKEKENQGRSKESDKRRTEADIRSTEEKQNSNSIINQFIEAASRNRLEMITVGSEKKQDNEYNTKRNDKKKSSDTRTRDLSDQGSEVSKEGITSPPYCDAQEMFELMFPVLTSGNSTSASSNKNNLQPVPQEKRCQEDDSAFARSSKTPRSPTSTFHKDNTRVSDLRNGTPKNSGYNKAQSKSEQDLRTLHSNPKRKILTGGEESLEEGELVDSANSKGNRSRSLERKKKRQSDY